MLGSSTALYRPFLKYCTLTNKAVETIWRALSKPPQRRQGPDPRPLWLLVGTPSAVRPELTSRRAEHSLPPFGCHYIYIWYLIFITYAVCVSIVMISSCGCWLVVHIRRFIYKYWNVRPSDFAVVAGSGKFGPVNRLNTPVGCLQLLQLTVLSRSAITV